MSKSRRRSVYLPDEHWGRLAEIAAGEQRSVNWLVRQAVADRLERPTGSDLSGSATSATVTVTFPSGQPPFVFDANVDFEFNVRNEVAEVPGDGPFVECELTGRSWLTLKAARDKSK